MAKFTVAITRTVERLETVTVNVTKDQVVDACGLEGEDRREWRDHVQEYLDDNTDVFDGADVIGTADEETVEIVVETVEA